MMRTLKNNEVKAEYVTHWDDYSTSVYSPCIINMETKEIVKIYKQGREVCSSDEDINNSNVDDMVDVLDREEVRIGDNTYLVLQENELDHEETETVYWYR